jgi:hypothetical protein
MVQRLLATGDATPRWAILLALAVALLALGGGAALRSTEYDET